MRDDDTLQGSGVYAEGYGVPVEGFKGLEGL